MLAHGLLALFIAAGQQGGQDQQKQRPGGKCLPYPNYRIETDRDFPLEMVPQVGHVEEVHDIAFSPDGRYLISGSRDHTLKLWSVDTGHLLRTVAARYEVRRIGFTSDGKTVVAGDARGYVWAWRITDGKLLLKADPKRCGSITDLEVIGNRSVLVSCIEPEVKLVDLVTGKIIRTFPHLDKPRYGRHPKGEVRIDSTAVAVTKDGKQMVVGYEKGGLKAWSVTSGKLLWERQGHRTDVTAVEILPGGRVLSATDDEMRYWRLKGGKPLGRTLMRDSSERLTAFTDGKNLLAVTSGRRGKGVLKLLSPRNGRGTVTLDDKVSHTGAVAVSSNGRVVASGTAKNDVVLIDVKKRKVIRTLRGADALVWDLALSPVSPPATAATAVGDGLVVIWNLDELAVENMFRPGYDAPMLLDYSPDGRTLLAGGRHGPAPTLWDVRRGVQLQKYAGRHVMNEGLIFSKDGHVIVAAGGRGKIDVLRADGGGAVRSFNLDRSADALAFSPDGRTLWIAVNFDLQRWDPRAEKELGRFRLRTNGVNQILPLPDGVRVAFAQGGGPSVWDTKTGKSLRRFGNSGQIYDSLAVSPDGCNLAGVGTPRTLDIWNVETGKSVASFPSHTNDTRRVTFLPDGRHLLTASIDGTMRLWDAWSGYSVSMIAREGEWVIYTDDGYFDASRRGGRLVAAVKGLNGYGIDQLSLRNNRPDLILSRLKLGSEELISHFHSLYRRRLKKVGIAEADLRVQMESAPVTTIESFRQRRKQVTLRFRMTDGSGLARYNIWVNDVPLYGAAGREVEGRSQTITERIELTVGRNEVEVSAINRAGIESYRPYRVAEYNGSPPADLYYVGFGVSRYRDEALDLNYAHKDAEDLATLFAAAEGYRNVHTKLFLDEHATREAIPAAAKFLAGSKVDDTVILFAAGHGLYDGGAEPRYYYVTHEADLDNLANTAVEFEKLEGLLDGIAARRKLFLMDTCQSGELVGAFGGGGGAPAAGGRGLRRRGAGIARAAGFVARPNRAFLLQRDRYIHNDLSRRTGAIVLSSSRGSEWSYEREDIQNGVFTEEVITALSSARADKDGDDRVSIDELRDYVMMAVPKATGDLQHPVVDRDNLEQRFSLPLVPPDRLPR